MSYAVDVIEPGPTVVGRSSRRLPFEPSGWLREFRSELARACRTLHADAGQTLHGVYTSPLRDAVDLENVLTYNLGTGALAAATRHALLLERSFDTTGDPDHEHHHRYHLADDDPTDDEPTTTASRGSAPLATIDIEAPPDAFRAPRAGRWWLLAARAANRQNHPSRYEPEGQFALSLTITPPRAWRGSLITLLKPLADGLVSALHRHDGPLDDVLDRTAAVDPTLSVGEMRELLQQQDAPLGATKLVWPWRQGLQWSPADERIVLLHARLTHAGRPGTVRALAYPALSNATS